MNILQRIPQFFGRRVVLMVPMLATVVAVSACGHTIAMLRGSDAQRPAEAEFGLGPRASTQGRYIATLAPDEPLRPRRMQSVRVVVHDQEGHAIEDATLTIDGGMPQHGHGLPTRPRITENLGGGTYVVEGLRFNMGGWWQLKLAIGSPLGADTATFNLDL